MLMIEFLEQNGDISVTKFLNDEYQHRQNNHGLECESENGYSCGADENDLMQNGQNIEKNAKKHHKKHKNGKKKSKNPFGNTDEDVVFVEFLETDASYYLQ